MEQARSPIDIQLLKPEDEQAFLGFYETNLKTWQQFKTFWEWRNNEPQHSGGETAAIATENKKIVGSVGLVPVDIRLKGEHIKTSWQQDSLVSSSMRGRGLGKKLVDQGSEGWDMVLAKGTSTAMYGLRKSSGFLDVQNSDYLISVCKPVTTGKGVKKVFAEYALGLWKTLLPMPSEDGGVKVQPIDQFDPSFDVLADKLSTENMVRPYKGHGYLNWRYFHCPGKSYNVFKAEIDHTFGAIVVNITGKKLDEGWIVDFICSPEDKVCAYALLLETMKYFHAQRVSKIWAFFTLPVKRRWLYRFGFVKTGLTPQFTYRVQQKSGELLTLPNIPWDFCHGDGDVELYNQ